MVVFAKKTAPRIGVILVPTILPFKGKVFEFKILIVSSLLGSFTLFKRQVNRSRWHSEFKKSFLITSTFGAACFIGSKSPSLF